MQALLRKGVSVNWPKLSFVAILLLAGSVSATVEKESRLDALLWSAGSDYATVEENSLSESTTVLLSWIKARAPYDPALIDGLQSPRVKIRSHAFFEKIACHGSKTGCHRIAWYNGGDTIFLRDDIDLARLEGTGILLHEVVHYVQEKSDRFVEENQCNRFRREREAYDLQKTYLIENGNYPTFAVRLSPPLGCIMAAQ
jgi:hypothetical protein